MITELETQPLRAVSAKSNDWTLPPASSSVVSKDEARRALQMIDRLDLDDEGRYELVEILGLDNPDFVREDNTRSTT